MLDIPQSTIPDLVAHHACHTPGKLAVVAADARLSWAAFDEAINRAANRFVEFGLRRGERVAFLMGNSAEHLYLVLGAMRAGGSAVSISSLLAPDQIADLVRNAEAVAVFVDSACWSLIEPVEHDLETVRDGGFFHDEASGRWRSWRAWLEGASTAHPGLAMSLDDEIAISYSSGTTGVPKGVVYSHRARQMMGLTYAIEMNFDRHAVALCTTPLYSNGTAIMLFPSLVVGATIVLMEKFDTGAFLDLVRRERVTHTLMVPTQYERLLRDPGLAAADLSSMKVFLTVGSPMRVETKKALLARLGPRLYEVYGFSEGGVTIIGPREMAERPTSVGIAVVGFEARIVDVESEREMPRGETGEIVLYGGWMMRGYQKNPQQTAALIWRDPRGRTFLRTGDIGRMDGDGYVYVVDRKKDMIISGGFNVFPADIEQVLGAHPDVVEATVIGVEHPQWGEAPFAIVILDQSARSTVEEVLSWANARLAKNQRIRGIAVRDELPRNALGKVLKPELRRDYADRFATEAKQAG